MEGSRFDRMTRRASLMTLGAAGLAGFTALARPVAADAKKKHKKKKADVNKLCKKQPGAWTSYLLTNGDGTPAQRQALNACGSKLGTCDFSGFWSCYVTAVAT
jgi:hypothetical protein